MATVSSGPVVQDGLTVECGACGEHEVLRAGDPGPLAWVTAHNAAWHGPRRMRKEGSYAN